ncbi:gamma-glutamyltranspeptidase [Mycolicibacterium sp. P9-64]|uniref:gamma-glutamyltransferase family protein n=1 Tax=Mycolicibacterium sp. P9-64 TaxID=2024612 RepID=UPI0011EFB719|nr:gamma-glutamyltransferase [Mycolicibacterium sp. P9-64]KAA0077359.1 gamma-glutamyltranspeptidase [Mycolicibacterium sp. P9-64]
MPSFTGALATPHALATEAGVRAYRDGGNAIDAAIAAAAVLTVVYPHNVALGGDLIALVRTPDGTVRCVNASGWAGAEVDAEALRAKHGSGLPARSVHSVTVPGGVRGWDTLRGFGARLSWERTLADAESTARAGTPVAPSLASHLADPENADLVGTEDFDRVFRPGGTLLGEGVALVQPALADTFEKLRHGGPGEFYSGGIAGRIVGYLRSRGSSLSADDFATFQPETVAPITLAFRGLTVLTSPPNTHGFLLLRALRAVEELGIDDPLGRGLGTLMRVFHQGNALRATRLADPRYADVDVNALVNARLDERAELVGAQSERARVPHGDTVGIAAADADGYAVSLIQSVYHAFGSGLIDPETGILFHNRGTGFSLDAASPNVIAPRKRPVHTLMPAMTTYRGAPRHVLATMGGQGQPQILAQVLLREVGGATAQAAVSAPRAIVGLQADGATVDSVTVEADMPAEAVESIDHAGLDARRVAAHTESLGHANVVVIDASGSMTAASDPRSDGAAAVVHYPRTTTG